MLINRKIKVTTMISSEQRNKLVENNQKISQLLEENENILRECGYSPPVQNFALDAKEKKKISFEIYPYSCLF